MANSFKVSGMEPIMKKLAGLKKSVGNKIVRNANRSGAKIFLNEMKRTVPVGSGTLKKSLKIKTPRARKDKISISIGTGDSFSGNFAGKTFYGAFVNYGTKKQKPNLFMTLAFKLKDDVVKRTVTAMIEDGVKTAI